MVGKASLGKQPLPHVGAFHTQKLQVVVPVTVSERMCALHLLFWAVAEQMGQAQLRVLGCGRSQGASLFLVSHGVWAPGSALGQLANAASDLGCPLTDSSLLLLPGCPQFLVSGSHTTQL